MNSKRFAALCGVAGLLINLGAVSAVRAQNSPNGSTQLECRSIPGLALLEHELLQHLEHAHAVYNQNLNACKASLQRYKRDEGVSKIARISGSALVGFGIVGLAAKAAKGALALGAFGRTFQSIDPLLRTVTVVGTIEAAKLSDRLLSQDLSPQDSCELELPLSTEEQDEIATDLAYSILDASSSLSGYEIYLEIRKAISTEVRNSAQSKREISRAASERVSELTSARGLREAYRIGMGRRDRDLSATFANSDQMSLAVQTGIHLYLQLHLAALQGACLALIEESQAPSQPRTYDAPVFHQAVFETPQTKAHENQTTPSIRGI